MRTSPLFPALLCVPLFLACGGRQLTEASSEVGVDDTETAATDDEVGTESGETQGESGSETAESSTMGEESVGEEETLGEETLGEEESVGEEETLGEETLGEETLGEETLGEETLGEETLGEETLGEETLGEETFGEETFGGETFGEGTEETGDPGECNGVCGTLECGACPDPEVIDLGDFSIAATEVTVTQYSMFLSIDLAPSFLPAECDWKADLTPQSWTNQLNASPDNPVGGIDWCDAWGYCEWSGGHLCGEAGGGAADINDYDDAATNEWYRACSGDGASIYPYGDTYDPMACNGVDAMLGDLSPVASLAGCEGGSAGIFDMSGNVWEWSSACNPNGDSPDLDACRRRGGSYFSSDTVLRCGINSTRDRNHRSGNTGARCCY